MEIRPFFSTRACFGLLIALVAVAVAIQPIRAQEPAVRPWLRPIVPPQGGARQAMQLREMEVSARITGLHVEATTTMTFFNPNSTLLEGELVFPLPDGAVVNGYALDINGQMVDGVIVNKDKARVVFETEVRRGVDPGLVEQVRGNVYRTRIYPLPPQGTRQIRLRYLAELPADKQGDVAWHQPFPAGETIGKLALRVEVAQSPVTPKIGGFGNLRFESSENLWLAKTELHDVKASDDLWVALPKVPAQVGAVERTADGEVFFAISDLAAPAAKKAPAPPRKLGLAWDASGSRAGEHLQRETAALQELLRRWPNLEIVLLVYRDKPEDARVFHGEAAALIQALNALPYDGGSDFGALAEAMKTHNDVDQWLWFTDGFDTLSDKLPDFAGRHVTAVTSQSVADRELLRQVCADSGGQVIDLQQSAPADAADAIIHPAPRLAAVHGTGIAEVQGLGTIAGGRVAIHGKLLAEDAELTLEYSDGHRSAPVRIARKNALPGTLLAGAWAAKRVSQLAVRAEANQGELLALGRRFGIVSPVTSLLVLENIDQYLRHDIEPPASQPELRRRWEDYKAYRAKEEENRRAGRLERVLGMWQERLAWWERDYRAPKGFKWLDHSLGARSERGHQLSSAAVPESAPMMAPPAAPMSAEPMPLAMGMPSAGADGARAHSSLSRSSRRFSGGLKSSFGAGGLAEPEESGEPTNTARIAVQPWDPSTPYLAALKAAAKDRRYAEYLEQRKSFSTSPAFFLDCSEFFLREGDRAIGVRVLTNLAELRLEDEALLRVLAWRLQQAGEVDRAVVLLRMVGRLRPEEPQSRRDLALALAERGKTGHRSADLAEAMALLADVVMGEESRFPEIEVIALEELNALADWVKSQKWDQPPAIPALDSRLTKNLDVDVRIVMSWDADNTDVDLHVVEPSGEEAMYNHNRTTVGGLVSHDMTQGYGPEEYLLRKAPSGAYKIFAHYYGSHQQTVVGPATITATVFTNFGRRGEKKQVLTLRLDKPRDKESVGAITFNAWGSSVKGEEEDSAKKALPGRDAFRALRVGQSPAEVERLVGKPDRIEDPLWIYRSEAGEYRVQFSNHALCSVTERLPGGAEMILIQ